MKVGVFTNLLKDGDLSVTRTLLDVLNQRGIQYALDVGLLGKLPANEYFSTEMQMKLDFMITVGGDGTILRIAKYCAEYDIPIAGLNLGLVGFLTEEDPDRTAEFIDALIGGNYGLEKRSLISAKFAGKVFYALNDIVISRAADSRMAEINVKINDEFVDGYFCDGFIISTPTGSTAYSLSAGGPILSPGVAAYSLVPINSHSLHSRPIVVSDTDVAKFMICSNGKAELVVDGVASASLSKNDMVSVEKAKKSVSFVRLSGHGFYEKLLTKLNKWSTTEKEN